MSFAWRPAVTVAALVERGGRFLLVEEQTPDGVRINQPAGHLDPGESLLDAVARETLEETACRLTATHLLGVYMWQSAQQTTFVRFAFVGHVSAPQPGRALDHGILRTLWLTRAEIVDRSALHRSPLVMRCVDDYLAGRRFALDVIGTDPSVFDPIPSASPSAEGTGRFATSQLIAK